MMRSLPFSFLRFSVMFAIAAGSVASVAFAAGGDLAQEYDQVRKIALRDPRVKEGFDRANERLTQKIVELDPALKGYAAGHAGQTPPATATAQAVHQPFVAATPAPVHTSKPAVQKAAAATPAPKPAVAKPVAAHPAVSHPVQSHAATARAGEGATHVVAPGETIAGIARRYNVSAASIETANHITDPRKLRAGQALVIPGGSASAAGSTPRAPAPPPAVPTASAPAPAPQQEGVWDKLKHSYSF